VIEQSAAEVLASFDHSILDAPRLREPSMIQRRLLRSSSIANFID
jgi:hypothetical protein